MWNSCLWLLEISKNGLRLSSHDADVLRSLFSLFQERMSEEYTHQLLRMVVGQICQPLGWNAMHSSACDVLADIMKNYILTMAKTTAAYGCHGMCVCVCVCVMCVCVCVCMCVCVCLHTCVVASKVVC